MIKILKSLIRVCLITICLISCNNKKEAIRKSAPTYYIFQHVDEIMLDSSIERIGYKLSDKEVTKEEVLAVEKIVKKNGWPKPYISCDSTKIFIPNYTSDYDDNLIQLYLIDSEIKK